jgi:low affinity Fe/Cu permease
MRSPEETVPNMPNIQKYPAKRTKDIGVFLRFANWISKTMGEPPNIIFWFILVTIWTCIFAFGGPKLSSGAWLPSWFTSQGFNFPLNLITTVAELFIGFLVAAAANRAQDALTVLILKIKQALDNDVALEKQIIANDKSIDHQLQVIARHLNIDPQELQLPNNAPASQATPSALKKTPLQ